MGSIKESNAKHVQEAGKISSSQSKHLQQEE